MDKVKGVNLLRCWKDDKGNVIKKQDYDGKIYLIKNCPACSKTLPYLVAETYTPSYCFKCWVEHQK